MGEIRYNLTQEFSDGRSIDLPFEVSTTRGTYNVICELSDGRTINAGKIAVSNNFLNQLYNLEIQLSNGEKIQKQIRGSISLNSPIIGETEYKFDKYMGAYWGSITVYNPNAVPVTCVVWYKTSNSSDVRGNGSCILTAGQSYKILFSDIYSNGIYSRLNFTCPEYGLYENNVFADCELGNYVGTYDFYGVEEESSTTTTTTTTVDELSTQPAPVESEGKFTLWRIQDVK